MKLSRKLTRPALKYFGGKWMLAPTIIKIMPSHKVYVEPYGGGANVLIRKQPSEMEVYNDLESSVYNYFYVLRNYPEELIALLELTPHSREEYVKAHEPCDDIVEWARRTFVISWQGYRSYNQCDGRADPSSAGGWTKDRLHTKSGKRYTQPKAADLFQLAYRLKQVSIECKDAISVILTYDSPNTLFYIDPPYPVKGKYKIKPKIAHHKLLAEVLNNLQGLFILSGLDSPLYNQLYEDLPKMVIPIQNNQNNYYQECIWTNYEVDK